MEHPKRLKSGQSVLWLPIYLAFFGVGISTASAFDLRGGVNLGLGFTSVSADSTNLVESPLAFSFTLQTAVSPSSLLSLDYIRSVSTALSSNTQIGTLSWHWFAWTDLPQPLAESPVAGTTDTLSVEGFFPYLKAGVGFAQGDLQKTVSSQIYEVSGAGPAIVLGAGVEYPWSGQLGLRAEMSLPFALVSSGSIQSFLLLGGIVWNFSQ